VTRAPLFVTLLLALLSTACAGGSPHPGPLPSYSPRPVGVILDDCPPGTYAGGSAQLPSLTLPCLGGGNTVTLTGLTGKPALVNIWGSWCIPCQREVPALQAVYAAVKGEATVLGVDMEDRDNSALDFAKHVGMRYPSVVDRNGDVLRRLGFAGAPSTVFLDASGAVVYKQVGQFKDAADLKAKVRRYLRVAS
jgi:thiol-disulfide isomerase/thioredoxin